MKLSGKLALLLGTLPGVAMAGEAGTVYTQIGTSGLCLGYANSVGKDRALRG